MAKPSRRFAIVGRSTARFLRVDGRRPPVADLAKPTAEAQYWSKMFDANGILVSEGLRADGVLIHAPNPLGTLWVPLSGGLTVLYGRNGAGKTRLLNAISCAMRGIALAEGHVSLHLSPVDYLGGFDTSLIERFQNVDEELGGDFGSPSARRPTVSETAKRGDDQATDEAVLGAITRLSAFLTGAAEKVGLADGRCHSPRLALVATGDAEHPSWRPTVSVVPTDVSGFIHEWRDLTEVIPWGEIRYLLDPGVAFLPSALVHLWTPDGWRHEPLPVMVARVPFNNGHLTSDQRDEGLSARDLIACLHATAQQDVNALTLASLRRSMAASGETSFIRWANEDDVEASETVAGRLSVLSDNASTALRELSGFTGTLQAKLHHPNRWPTGQVVSWLGTDPFGATVEIDDLGAGSARWARLAISLALGNADWSHASVVMIDEPERALHSAAQQEAAASLARMVHNGELGSVPVVGAIVATHSAAFLAQRSANLVHVSRDTDGAVALDGIDPTLGVEGLTAALGISRADALLTTRWFLFVEGEHDAAIFRTLFGEILQRAHAVLRTMDGAANLSAHLNAEFLLTYSDAGIRVVLDRIGAAATSEWDSAVTAARNSDREAARRHLEKLSRGKGRESAWLYEAGIAALSKGYLDRIQLVGLERPDIICYLPPGAIVPGATSWQQLGDEYFTVKPRPAFKQWLRDSKGANFGAESLSVIAAGCTDLADLPNAVQGL